MESLKKEIHIISNSLRRAKGKAAAEAGLGSGEMRTLRFIHHTPGITQRQITEKLGIDKAATARQCASLEEKGFIRKEKNEKDGRSFCLYPTDKADILRTNTYTNEDKVYEDLLHNLTDEEKDELARLLKKICSGLEDDGPEARQHKHID